MILTCDPGARWAIAYGTTSPTVVTGRGLEAFEAAVASLPPAVAYLECPFQQVCGIPGHKGNVAQLRTWLAMRDVLWRKFGAVQDLNVATWQAVQAPYAAEANPKHRSLRVVQALGWDGPWQTARGGVDGEAVDAAAMFAAVLARCS